VKQINDALRGHSLPSIKVENFLEQVEFMVSIYLGTEKHERALKKTITRDSLNKLDKTIKSAIKAYHDLDKLSLALLGREYPGGNNELLRHLEAMQVYTGRALNHANALPAKFSGQSRLWIACDVARYLRD
jgi:hypothetical protein